MPYPCDRDDEDRDNQRGFGDSTGLMLMTVSVVLLIVAYLLTGCTTEPPGVLLPATSGSVHTCCQPKLK